MEIFTQHLSKEQLALLPTEEDVAFYEEHGWYISKKVIPEKLIDEAILDSERYYRGERDTSLHYSTSYCDWKPGDGDDIRNNEYTSLQNRELCQLAPQLIIGAIAARLARTKQIRLFQDNLVYKPPMAGDRKGAIGWHTDHSYVSNSTSNNLLAVWIPFQHCDESMEPLVVLDRSHTWSGTEHLRLFNHQNLKEILEQFRREGRKIVEIPMTLKKGQISFHHSWAVHGSYLNCSNSVRLSMTVHLQDEANRYQPFWSQTGEQINHFVDRICRKLPNGYPDYSDPAMFPVLWSEEA